jgi:ribose transport system substrate-binding protein
MANKRSALRPLGAAIAATLCAAALAACSSSGGSAGSSNSRAASDAGSTGSSTGGSSQVTAAQAIVDKLSKVPTTIPLTTPLKAKPASAKTVVWMQCKLPQCIQIGDGIRPAAKALGWTLKTITYDSADPANLVSGMQKALQYKPDAVINSGLPQATWASVLPAYKSANVPIVTSDIGPQAVGFPVVSNIYGDKDTELQGQAVGNWFIADSQAKGKALLVDVPSFPVLHAFSEAFKGVVSKGCADCTLSTLQSTIPDVQGGKLNGQITAALRKDPSIKYLVVCDAAFIGALPPAMAAAGLSSIKIAGAWGDKATENYLKTGQIKALSSFATEYQGWQSIDAVARYLEGTPGQTLADPSNGTLPIQLLTKESLQTPSDSYNYPKDFREQFKKLWLVG